jgi:hypothetical protein
LKFPGPNFHEIFENENFNAHPYSHAVLPFVLQSNITEISPVKNGGNLNIKDMEISKFVPKTSNTARF